MSCLQCLDCWNECRVYRGCPFIFGKIDTRSTAIGLTIAVILPSSGWLNFQFERYILLTRLIYWERMIRVCVAFQLSKTFPIYDISQKIIYLKPQIEIDSNGIVYNGFQFQQSLSWDSQQYHFKSIPKFQPIQQVAE